MSSFFDNIINRTSKNAIKEKTHKTPKIQYRRFLCNGCGSKIYFRTLKLHKKLFLRKDGTWIKHNAERNSIQNNLIEKKILSNFQMPNEIIFSDHIPSNDLDIKSSYPEIMYSSSNRNLNNIQNDQNLFEGGLLQKEYCLNNEYCSICMNKLSKSLCKCEEKSFFSRSNGYEMCCSIFNLIKNDILDHFLPGSCSICQSNHFHAL